MEQRVNAKRQSGLAVVRLASRALCVFCVAIFVGWVLHWVSGALQTERPAGFGSGMLHGALMPMALPNLLVGQDISIYALNNTGLPYKLGYTVGVNLCGLIFFGLFFWRVRRWKNSNFSKHS